MVIKMLKKSICVILSLIMCVSLLSACNIGSSGELKGAHIFMFKNTGNAFGDLMYKGFSKVVSESGERAVYKCPAEPSVALQVEMLDTLITQKVASITVSTAGETGYEEVFKRAEKNGIKIISVDSSASPDYRTTHIEQTNPNQIGTYLIQSAVLIALGIDYKKDMDMETAVKEQLEKYSGKPLKFGVLTAAVDTPVQNLWIDCMKEELEKSVYNGKVEKKLDIKYGNDDPTESTTQANAFVAENKVDVIISPTTIGMASAGQVLKTSSVKIKLTGLGLPSEMQGFMPKSADDNAFDYVCPYMMLWNVEELGEVAAAAVLSASKGDYDGKEGSVFTYKDKKYETVKSPDGGTRVIALEPYIFYKENMKDWISLL